MIDQVLLYEDRNTYYLKLDHSKKTFSVGHEKGTHKKPGYRSVSPEEYKSILMTYSPKYRATIELWSEELKKKYNYA